MKTLFGLLVASLSLMISPSDEQTFGSGVSKGPVTDVRQILERPTEFEGKVVRIKGTFVDVCSKMGCWVEMRDDSGQIQVKVNDGVIVFPVTLKGKSGIAEGRVEVLHLSRDEFIAMKKHEAEEQGKAFDPEAVDPPYEIIRLQGLGAVDTKD